MTKPYPRDMVGYGGEPPDPKWPSGARLAVNFVLNYEEPMATARRKRSCQRPTLGPA